MTGRPPKPNALKLLSGSRHARDDEPTPPPGTPKPPKHLAPAALAKWRALVPILREMRVLTVADGDMLAAYCVAWARWVDAETHLAAEGAVVMSPNNYGIPNAWLPISNKALETMEKLASRFGFTPVDRNRIHAAPTLSPDDAEFEALIASGTSGRNVGDA